MLENYCADIERQVREGMLRAALPLSVALPAICAALEEAQMNGTRERYLSWCASWFTPPKLHDGKLLEAERLYRLYAHRQRSTRQVKEAGADPTTVALAALRRVRRARRERALTRPRVRQPTSRIEAFQIALIEALIAGSRRWYAESGAHSALVQRNLGRLLITG